MNADPPTLVGSLLDGKYRVLDPLGDGAFAVVYGAEHVDVPGMRLAIKVLKAEHAREPSLRQRFSNEARALAALSSRHTVRVTDVGTSPEGNPYLVMERLEGVTIKQLIAVRGPLHVLHCAQLARDVLTSLIEAHELGVVHRDLKPSNIFVVHDSDLRRPVAKVVDFGIAKLLADGALRDAEQESTVEGTPCTPTFAAPEQLRGRPGPTSDVYALGHVMATMLTGAPPYKASSTVGAIALHLDSAPVPLGSVIVRSVLADIVKKACAKDVAERFESATAMCAALDEVLEDLKGPKLELPVPRVTFAGSGDFTAPATWSAIEPASTLSDRGDASALQSDVPTAPSADHEVVPWSRRWVQAATIAVVAVAGVALYGVAMNEPIQLEGMTSPMVSQPGATLPGDGSADADPAVVPPEAIASAMVAGRAAVRAAVRVDGANAWSLSSPIRGARVSIEGPGVELDLALPMIDVFGPAIRPLVLTFSADGHDDRVERVEEPRAVGLLEIELQRRRRVEPPSGDGIEGDGAPGDGPRPGSITVLRP